MVQRSCNPERRGKNRESLHFDCWKWSEETQMPLQKIPRETIRITETRKRRAQRFWPWQDNVFSRVESRDGHNGRREGSLHLKIRNPVEFSH
ncbi:hypothetical protein TNCT_433651 [Trichonephila clavata]|uniref:Uncharacterized protein n=1 Tax=Trichonephila clavata TaxID=2740835 RepID=A0A8X6F9Q9_TRICU|nr:hypothetical protein TNCT_433651 [Trichonephila clavata]